MPCTYESTESELFSANEEISRLTVLLCEAIQNRSDNELTNGLLDWRNKHEKKEHARILREAVAKLTPQERRVLGL